MIDKTNIQDIYGLSAMQKAMLITYMKDENTLAYIEQFSFPLYGEVEPEFMEKALNMLIAHYDVFRTVFAYKTNENPYQIVLKHWEAELQVIDLSKEDNPEEKFRECRLNDRQHAFSLTKEILVRGTLYKTGAEEWRFLFTFHHIILDGWSLGMVFSTLFTYYKMLCDQKEIKQGKEAVSYKNYIKWLEKQDDKEAADYWNKYLDGYEKEAGIPCFSRTDSEERISWQFSLEDEWYESLKKTASENALTLNIIFQATWGVILQKFNNTEDVVFGNVVSGRAVELQDAEKMAGLLINTQPIRICSRKDETFLEMCKDIQRKNMQSAPYEYYPLYQIQSGTKLKNNIMDHAIAFENYPLENYMKEVPSENGKTLRFGSVDVTEQATYNLHIIVNPGKEFKITFTYSAGAYTKEQMKELGECVLQVLRTVCKNPEIGIRDIDICPLEQRERILNGYQGKEIGTDEGSSVTKAFRKYVEKNPEKKAIVHGDMEYTYEEVNRMADQMAYQLVQSGVKKGERVGLFIERSAKAVIAMLGILKAGAVYIPFNVKESDERLNYIIGDAEIRCICVTEETAGRIPQGVTRVIVKESEENAWNWKSDIDTKADDAAYILYTSGTTGKPKGCFISNQNILRTVQNQKFIPFTEDDVVLQTASVAFDPSVVEIWGALCNGGTLVIISDDKLLVPEEMKKTIQGSHITSMQLTTPLFNRFAEENADIFATVKNLMVGGDVLHKKFVRKVLNANPSIRLINGYGPTENTVVSTTYTVEADKMEREKISIGMPLNNSFAYVMDSSHHILPVGAIGELCVGGSGLSAGYLNRKELTETKFIENPYKKNSRMFCTGDLAMLLPDGNIEFLGRADFQVKVNGYRIELGEIEQKLNEIPEIKESVVCVKEAEDSKYLCAFYTGEKEFTLPDMKKELQAKLPGYMIPTYYVRVEQFEMTPNGKINRNKLCVDIRKKTEQRKIIYSTEIEKKLVEIINAVTGFEQIETDENLFDIGVNSLNLMSIRNRLNKELGYDIALSVLFEQTTVNKLARYIERTFMGKKKEENKTETSKVDIRVMKNGIRRLRQNTEEDW